MDHAPTIRSATQADAPVLAELKRTTFRQTFLEEFAIPYPPADLALFEEQSYGPARMAAELTDPTHHSWIAELDGRAVGYAHVGPCKLPHPEASDRQGEIYQLYLRREAQGHGLGKRLLQQSLDYLAQHFPGPVWLGVWSGNLRAQNLYAGYGFARVGDYRFPVGDWLDEEFIFRRDAAV